MSDVQATGHASPRPHVGLRPWKPRSVRGASAEKVRLGWASKVAWALYRTLSKGSSRTFSEGIGALLAQSPSDSVV